ncbi:hypothetical protein [Brachybacterium sp. GPGPB12]|uniref:hypothetical protein n=1 Tax=Brachybacterium sp. GPGPB12 TaxID=3023517 RepID=UPI0031342629
MLVLSNPSDRPATASVQARTADGPAAMEGRTRSSSRRATRSGCRWSPWCRGRTRSAWTSPCSARPCPCTCRPPSGTG